MAQKVQVVLVDDLDGGHADETVTFSLDGVAYEIDLSHDNAAALRDTMATYVAHARRLGSAGRRAGTGRSRAKAGGSGSADGPSPAVVREWAKSQGIAVNERGRISADLQAKFQAAHP
ncbi:MAG TPA: Lsr2 family protein [Candidatus Nanopelagicales bacterium]|nr:Lsr2 family protein [Candidatus Nanopelagicales bacterium]